MFVLRTDAKEANKGFCDYDCFYKKIGNQLENNLSFLLLSHFGGDPESYEGQNWGYCMEGGRAQRVLPSQII